MHMSAIVKREIVDLKPSGLFQTGAAHSGHVPLCGAFSDQWSVSVHQSSQLQHIHRSSGEEVLEQDGSTSECVWPSAVRG